MNKQEALEQFKQACKALDAFTASIPEDRHEELYDMPERQKLKRASEAARDKAIELGATQSDIVEVVFGIADEEGILEDMFDVMDALESA